MPPSRRFKAAAVQFEPRLGRVADNLAGLLALAEAAARGGCRLIVLPEMGTTGYCFDDREEIAPLLESLPGPSADRFADLAARHACYIVFGLAERDRRTGRAYNAAALIGPHGLIGHMRKVHLTGRDSRWASPGDLGFPTWATEIGRITAQICLDACYPEAARAAALQGAEIIALPTNWDHERAPSAVWFTRAFENGAYFIAADRYSSERGCQFSGGSCILGPQGELLAHLDIGDGLAVAEIDLAHVHSRPWPWSGAGDKLAERRPEQYGSPARAAPHLPEGRQATVAVIQSAGAPGEAAREKAAALIARVLLQAPERPALVVLPELALIPTLRAMGEHGPAEWAESIPGPTSAWAAGLCREAGVYLALGLPERAGAKMHNSAILAGPEGLVGVYRKLHLTAADRTWAAPGDGGLQTWDLPLGRVGMLIGHDAMFPEPARRLALAGVDLILAPSAVPGPCPLSLPQTSVRLGSTILQTPLAGHWHLWRARAAENNCFLAFANRADEACMGWSGLFGPDLYTYPRAESVLIGGGEGAAWLQVDTREHLAPGLPNPGRTKSLVRGRTPGLFEALLRQSPPRPAA